MRQPRLLLAAVLAVLCGVPSHVPTRLAGSASRPEAVRPSPDWVARVRDRIAAEEYQVSVHEGALLAPNRRQGLRTRFAGEGVRVTSREHESETPAWEWRTRAFGRAGAMRPLARTAPTAERSSVRYAHGEAFVEWYENRPEGLEQGFTLAARPEGEGALRIEADVRHAGEARVEDGGSSLRWTHEGKPTFACSGLVAFDADGARLPAHFEKASGGAAIVVDDAGARYPVTVDPVLALPSRTWAGHGPSANLGSSVASAGDVNGDGYGDVLISESTYDAGGLNMAGKAFLYMGGPNGPAATPAWSDSGVEATEWFGREVAPAGDVNADGYDDFVVGAPNSDLSGSPDGGRVMVYYGSASGVKAQITTIPGFAGNGRYGLHVKYAGDVNGDGYDDVFFSGEDAVYLYFGGPGVLQLNGFTRRFVASLNFDPGPVIGGGGDINGDGYDDLLVVNYLHGDTIQVNLGGPNPRLNTYDWGVYVPGGSVRSVAFAGDVDGDGRSDLLMGEPDVTIGAHTKAGRARLMRGATSPPSTFAWSLDGTETDARLGQFVSTAGDLDADGYADFAVGEPWHAGFDGRVLIVHGRATSLTFVSYDQELTAPTAGTGSRFGLCVASAGDVNGDGLGDLLVGAPYESTNDTWDGEALLYYGAASRALVPSTLAREGNQADARFGSVVAGIGDVNHDGYADIAVAAPYYDNGAAANAGRVTVYHGSDGEVTTFANWTLLGTQADAHLGAGLCGAGDVNGDGYDDVAVGSPAWDGDQAGEGRVEVFHGGPTGLATTAARTLDGNVVNAGFGAALASAGDVNRDGRDDLVIGTSTFTNAFTAEGKIFVYLGGAAGLAASPQFTRTGGAVGAQLGYSVAGAGDVNRDGYDDIAAGASGVTSAFSLEGAAYVFYGSASGVQAAGSTSVFGGQAGMALGRSVCMADLDGDGCAELVAGAPFWDGAFTSQGLVRAWHGATGGLSTSPWWSYSASQTGGLTGWSVANAGDVNGDLVCDIVIGQPGWDGAAAVDGGRVQIAIGGVPPSTSSTSFSAEGVAGEQLGSSVAGAGDTNGDGLADVLAGALHFGTATVDEGRLLLWYGGQRYGTPRPLTIKRGDGALVSTGAIVPASTGVTAVATRRTAGGRDRVRLQYQLLPVNLPFGPGLIGSLPWSAMTGVSNDVAEFPVAAGYPQSTDFKLRVRTAASSPWFRNSRWQVLPTASPTEPAFGTAAPTLDVDDSTEPAAALSFAPPAPQPSRGATRLRFSLPAATQARLEVFDAQGRRVATLADGAFAPGEHAVEWRGDGIAPGVYLARLTTAAGTATRTIVRLDH